MRGWRAAGLILTAWIVAGCSGDPTGTIDSGKPSDTGGALTETELLGAYRLVAVGGAALPSGYDVTAVIGRDTVAVQRIRYLNGSLTLRENGEWSLRHERRVTRHGGDERTMSESMEGLWSVSESTVVLTRIGGTPLTATATAGVLTVTDPDIPPAARFTWAR